MHRRGPGSPKRAGKSPGPGGGKKPPTAAAAGKPGTAKAPKIKDAAGGGKKADVASVGTTDSAKTAGVTEPNVFKEIFDYQAALPKAPDHPEGVQVKAGLSTLAGVYLPCFQNILGVIVFLRLTWFVGEAGALEIFQVIFTCCLITFTTSVSMAAIATNGPVPAGGAYYMINRCLGPEFGGAVGILFYLGTTIGSSMYVIGAIELMLLYVIGEQMMIAFTAEKPTAEDAAQKFNNFRIYGTALLLALASIVYLGVVIVTKFAIVALICVIMALLSIFVGIFYNWSGNHSVLVCVVGKRLVKYMEPSKCTVDGLKEVMCDNVTNSLSECDAYFNNHISQISLQQAFPGISSNTIFDAIYNLYSGDNDYISWSYDRTDYAPEDTGTDGRFSSSHWVTADSTTSFLIVLGIFFPSCTGIMAGSNRSGDLKKPQHAIPIGTIAAILTTSFIYLSMGLLYAGTVNRLVLLDKFGKSLAPGSGGMVAAYLSIPHKYNPTSPTATEIGALLSTIGAGLQSLTGAPRLLQAIAKDGFIPMLNPFATLDNRGEPCRALVLTVCIAEVGIIMGDLDLIAPLLSMFFLLFYAGVNVACTVMSLSANPGWRPSFRYYHWSISLIGVVLCVGAMFSIDYKLALLALAIFAVCFYGIKFFGGVQEWGAGVRGLALSFATQSLIRVSKTYEIRYWRPQIIHIITLDKKRIEVKPKEDVEGVEEHPGQIRSAAVQESVSEGEVDNVIYEWKVRRSDIQLFNLGSQIKQGAGLAIGGCVVTLGASSKMNIINKLKVMIQQTMKKQDLDGLAEVSVSKDGSLDNVKNAISSLIQLTGLGTLRPNTVMVNFPKRSSKVQYEKFKRVLEEAVAYEKAVIVPVGGVRTWDEVVTSKERGYIDLVLLNQHDSGLLLMIAYLIHNHPM